MNPLYASIVTCLLVYRAYTRKSLTTAGIIGAIITAAIHSLHPSSLPFVLLITFYTLGTTATKIKKEQKAMLVLQNDGGGVIVSGGKIAREGHSVPTIQDVKIHTSSNDNNVSPTRGLQQVLCNSGISSLLCLIDFLLSNNHHKTIHTLILIGIISNYASTTSDTLSSELGILSPSPPYLITSLTPCPPGTNGGVSILGLLSALSGSLIISLISSIYFPWEIRLLIIPYVTSIGLMGTLLDSLLGAVFQPTVVDVKSGKVIENHHGGAVLVEPGERKVTAIGAKRDVVTAATAATTSQSKSGGSRKVFAKGGGKKWGIVLTNNGVNIAMAGLMSLVGMVGWYLLMGKEVA